MNSRTNQVEGIDVMAAYCSALLPASRDSEPSPARPGVAPRTVSFGHIAYVAAVHGVGVEAPDIASLPGELAVNGGRPIEGSAGLTATQLQPV